MTDHQPLSLVHHSHPLLQTVAPKMEFPLSDEVKQDLSRLGLTMLSFGPRAVGLAANQVGLPHRAFAWTHPEYAGVIINPVFADASDEPADARVDLDRHRYATTREGCLSLPHLQAEVKRLRKIWATYQTVSGEVRTVELTGLWSTCFQHETDHLNGILVYHHLPKAEQEKVLAAQAKQERRNKRTP